MARACEGPSAISCVGPKVSCSSWQQELRELTQAPVFSSLQRLCLIFERWSWLLWQAPSASQKWGAALCCWEVQRGMKLSLGVGSLRLVLILHLTPGFRMCWGAALGC